MTKSLLLAVIGVTALIVNPFFACDGPLGGTFRYGAAEMRAAVEGTWTLRLPGERGAPPREVRISIRQSAHDPTQESSRGGLVRSANACESRSFVRSAGACMDMSSMPLDVKLIAGATTKQAPTGMFRVFSIDFGAGELELYLDDLHVSGVVRPSGQVSEVTTWKAGVEGMASLIRVSR